MSAVSTRNKANTIESVAIPAGAIVLGACLFGLAKGLSALANAALQSAENKGAKTDPQRLQSVAALRTEFAPFINDSVGENLEALKTQAFRQLAGQPFLVPNRTELATSILALDRAATLKEVVTAHQNVAAKLESGHQQIYTTALLEAAKRAALKTGFTKIESLPSSFLSTARFAATDAAGKIIITEIYAPLSGDARLATEVVGVSDGSCHAVLDAFDRALEAEGIRSQPAKRRNTGGVCELAAVRDFLSRQAQPATTSSGQAQGKDLTPASNAKRRQRLNQKRHEQKQK